MRRAVFYGGGCRRGYPAPAQTTEAGAIEMLYDTRNGVRCSLIT